jgi:hypothetical protein
LLYWSARASRSLSSRCSLYLLYWYKVHRLTPEELLQRKAARLQKHYNLCRAIVDQVSVFVLLYQ